MMCKGGAADAKRAADRAKRDHEQSCNKWTEEAVAVSSKKWSVKNNLGGCLAEVFRGKKRVGRGFSLGC
jgi:hypothetical protein